MLLKLITATGSNLGSGNSGSFCFNRRKTRFGLALLVLIALCLIVLCFTVLVVSPF